MRAKNTMEKYMELKWYDIHDVLFYQMFLTYGNPNPYIKLYNRLGTISILRMYLGKI